MTLHVRGLALLLMTTVMAGCAAVQPTFGPEPTAEKAYDSAPTLQNAIAVGTSMRERYTAQVENQIAWERGIGVGLIGGAAIAADLAMRSVGKAEILGLGLAGAAAYTSGNWLFSKPQQLIYAAGASAVQCALAAMQPLQIPYQDRDELKTKINEIVTTVDEIDSYLLVTGNQTARSEAIAAVRRANALLPAAREALALLDNAGGVLRSSLSVIQLQVTNAYINNSPNMQGLVASLGAALPAMGTKIIGVSLPPVPPPGTNVAELSSPLKKKTEELNQLVARVARIVESVSVKPSADSLKLCSVDLKQAGLSMKIIPAGDLLVRPGSSGTVVVSGGVLPYRAEWIGERPTSDQVSLIVESGQGFITIDAKPGAKPSSYQLLLLDAGQGREVVGIVISGEDVKQLTPKSAKPTSSPNSTVRRIQQALIDKGFGVVKVDGRDVTLVADGRNGKITIEAMRQFYRRQGATDDQIPKGDQLVKEVAQLLQVG